MLEQQPIIVQALTVSPVTTVAEGLALLYKHNIRSMPVVDGEDKLLGIFSFRQVFKFMLPAAVTMEGGLASIDFVFDTAPGAAKRLGRLHSHSVVDVMERTCPRLNADTPMWEMLRLLMQHGSPLPVVDEASNRLLGIISDQSVLSRLEDVFIALEAEGQV